MIRQDLRENLLRIFVFAFLIITFSITLSVLVALAEHKTNPNFELNVITILWWWLVTISTVGYGDIAPITTEGRFLASIIIFTGWIFFAILISEFYTLFRMLYKFNERGLMKVGYSNHIVIVGYSPMTQGIVDSIRNKFDTQAEIVIISEYLKVYPIENVHFVRGDAMNPFVLEQANISQASTVFVIAEERRMNPDAYSIVVANRIENINQDIFTVVEITNENMKELYNSSLIDVFIDHRHLLAEILNENSDIMKKVYEIIDEGINPEKTEYKSDDTKTIPSRRVDVRTKNAFEKIRKVLRKR